MRWSHSAHQQMRRCNRQLIYSQLIARGSSKTSPERREAFVLKQLQQVSAWQGHVVHQVLAQFLPNDLTAGRGINWERVQAGAIDLAKRQFTFSATHRYREPEITKSRYPLDYCALAGHDTPAGLPAGTLDAAIETISAALSFLESEVEFLNYLRSGTGYRSEQALQFRLTPLKLTATATVDLIFFRGVAKATVVDWKIGNSETADYERQLQVYALAALRCGLWPEIVHPENVDLIEANLLQRTIKSHRVSEERLMEIEDFVFRSASDMEALFDGLSWDSLNITDFETTSNPTNCAFCPFRVPCATDSTLSMLGPLQGDLFV